SQSQQQIGPLLSRLRDLTLDNPDQQSRLGALQSVVDHRVDVMRQALETYSDGHPGAAYRMLGNAANTFPYKDLAEDVVNAESRLQQQRVNAAQRKTHTAKLVQTGAALAQLVLLGLVVIVSESAIS